MKVRVGFGAGQGLAAGGELPALAADLEELGFDSLWLPEVLTTPAVDPLIGLAVAGATVERLKLGTTMLLPGRNPVRLAKQLADLDQATGGRLLVTFVSGLARPPERTAVGVPVAARGAQMEEALPLLRRLWAGEAVDHQGELGRFDGVSIASRPRQDPFDVWLGGMAPSALERCGRLADGWLPSACTPEEAADGRRAVESAAAEAGRQISPEHFGVSIAYSRGPIDERLRAALAALSRRRAAAEVEEVVPVGLPALRDLLERFVAVGFSKFVVRPVVAAELRAELEALADAVLDLQR